MALQLEELENGATEEAVATSDCNAHARRGEDVKGRRETDTPGLHFEGALCV